MSANWRAIYPSGCALPGEGRAPTGHQLRNKEGTAMSLIYTGHDPYYGDADGATAGTDVLVTIWDDGSMEVALRPGRDNRSYTWGPPAALTVEEVSA